LSGWRRCSKATHEKETRKEKRVPWSVLEEKILGYIFVYSLFLHPIDFMQSRSSSAVLEDYDDHIRKTNDEITLAFQQRQILPRHLSASGNYGQHMVCNINV